MILHCTDCNHESDYVDLQIIEYEGELKKLCDICYDNYVSCTHCGKSMRSEDGYWSDVEEGFYCNECKSTELTFCDDCEHEINSDEASCNDNDRYVCTRCSENYFSCDACGITIHSDNTYSSDRGDGCFCESCCHYLDNRVDLRSYNGEVIGARDNVQWDMYKAPYENTIYMGVEIEMEYKDGNYREVVNSCEEYISNRYVLKEDGSLDNGVELVITPHTLRKWHGINTHKLLKSLSDKGLRSHDTQSCGLHVHVNRDGLGANAVQKLWRFVIANRNQINKLARRYSERWASIPSEYSLSMPNQRYMAINLQNTDTIEFRCFKGTLNPDTFKATLQFIDSLINFVNEHSLAMFHNGNSWSIYIDYIRKSNRYNKLINYLIKRGVINE